MKSEQLMEPEQLKLRVVEALEALKGRDILALDVRDFTGMTDYMVIATGTSNRHVKALAESAIEELREEGIRPLGKEGELAAEWVLVDYGDVVLHVMLPETRAFYDLERLWSDGKVGAPENPTA